MSWQIGIIATTIVLVIATLVFIRDPPKPATKITLNLPADSSFRTVNLADVHFIAPDGTNVVPLDAGAGNVFTGSSILGKKIDLSPGAWVTFYLSSPTIISKISVGDGWKGAYLFVDGEEGPVSKNIIIQDAGVYSL